MYLNDVRSVPEIVAIDRKERGGKKIIEVYYEQKASSYLIAKACKYALLCSLYVSQYVYRKPNIT